VDHELLPTPSHIMGPTWQRRVDGTFHLPEHSLGYDILYWLYQNVNSPDGSGPFRPTKGQARFIVWWYAGDDEGKFVYRDGVLRRLKGWGKDPMAAALALAELCGPVRFSHWNDEGRPVGKPAHAAWIQIVAVSQDQTKNTFLLFPVMVSEKLKTEHDIDMNKFVIYASGGRLIESVTASPASMEGKRPTFVIKNETQWWGTGPDGKVNEGIAMSEVIRGNVGKIPSSRALAICNAHIPGNGSVGEEDYDLFVDIQAGNKVDPGLLYDALEAPANTPVSEIPPERDDPEGYALGLKMLREGIITAAGDSIWLPVDELVNTVIDRRSPVSESRRKFLNQVNAHEDSWIAPNEWDAVMDPELPPLQRRERITLGFDGSKSDDHTALVACRVEDGAIFPIKSWDPLKYPNEEIPREDVDAVVRSMFAEYDVVGFRADVKEFEAYVDQWGTDFRRKLKVKATPGNPVAFDMRGQTKKFALDCERFVDAVLEHEITHNGDPKLRQHVLNARRHPTTFDAVSIRKASKDSSRKIDLAMCAVLAYGSRQDFLMSNRNRPRKAVALSG